VNIDQAQPGGQSPAPATGGRKRPAGEATTDVILTSHTSGNAPVFRDVLRLYVPEGSTIADVTYGKGAFWKDVPDGTYKVLPTDIQTGVDCRELPYEDCSLDAVVLDPPYMEGLFRQTTTEMAGSGSHAAFRRNYSDGRPTPKSQTGPRWHDAVLDLYLKAGQEAWRTLRNYGIFIVKCQDEVSANTQRLTHIELVNAWSERFYCKDMFVVTRVNRPGIVRVVRQEHARKNHSYFLVFVKRNPDFPRRVRPTLSEARQLQKTAPGI